MENGRLADLIVVDGDPSHRYWSPSKPSRGDEGGSLGAGSPYELERSAAAAGSMQGGAMVRLRCGFTFLGPGFSDGTFASSV